MRRSGIPTAAIAVLLLNSSVGSVHGAGIPATSLTRFGPSAELSAGLGSQSVAVADLDRDGFADLVVANVESNDVSFIYGVGGGSFELPVGCLPEETSCPVLSGPSGVAIADMDHDGRLDVVVVHDAAGEVIVLRQLPQARTFEQVSEVTVGSGPEGLAVADFDGDHNLDVATANFLDIIGSVSVVLGDGQGGFKDGPSICLGGAMAGESCDPGTVGSCGQAVTCGPKRDFQVVPSPDLLGGPVAIVSADLNRDGKVDLIVANNDGANIAILPGRGNGTFDAPQNFTVGGAPTAVAVTDIDIDGRADVVTANEDDSTVSVLFGTSGGQGSFQFEPKTDFAVGTFPAAVTVWDFNLDGRPDIAVANTVGTQDAVAVLRRADTCAADARASCLQPLALDVPTPDGGIFFIGSDSPASLATADFNGDHKRDIATANAEAEDETTAVSILLNQGSLVLGDSDGNGQVSAEDVLQGKDELFDGDGSTVITVAGGTTMSGPGVDGNGDESVSAADLVAIARILGGNGSGPS